VNAVCATCGTQFAETLQPPAHCPICEDERQYVGWGGQQWTDLDQLRSTHKSVVREEAPGLTGIGTEPSFAIGQRALLVKSPGGNVLWDCISLIDEAAVRAVRDLGGIRAIAISHPHYYSSMVEWSRAFGDAPIYLHQADREWVMRPDPAIVYWEGDTRELWDGLTLIRCGGHFAGGAVLHWKAGRALLSGDIIQVAQDRRWVSFMYSYPNLIPLPGETVRRIERATEPFDWDRLFGAWFDRNILSDAKKAVRISTERYVQAIHNELSLRDAKVY
jgi:glyoxylase-like metal-dependent hydrolase (beta-lactamase superfamily II)